MTNQIDTLIKMLNQIAANNIAYETEEAADRISKHIKLFWALSMKKTLLNEAKHIESELSPVELMAVKKLEQDYANL